MFTQSLGCLEIVALPNVDKGWLKLFWVYILIESARLCETDLLEVSKDFRQTSLRRVDIIRKQCGNIQNETDT